MLEWAVGPSWALKDECGLKGRREVEAFRNIESRA